MADAQIPCVLGLELNAAQERLALYGFCSELRAVASRKGGGSVPRVIRQSAQRSAQNEKIIVELCYSYFNVLGENEADGE